MQTSAGPTWIHNPTWPLGPRDGLAAGPLHGTLTRHALDCGGSLSLEECFALAAPHFLEALSGWLAAPEAPRSITVVGAHQVHGDHLEVMTDAKSISNHPIPFHPPQDIPLEVHEAVDTDALVTSIPGVVLVIKTADCLPILFWDPETRTVAAAHCGWRGLMAGLAAKTAGAMIEIGGRAESIQAWLGPGIRKKHYQVSSDLADRFREAFPGAGLEEGRYLDLFAVAAHQLEKAGLVPEHIHDSGECTFANRTLYHSFRRDGDLAGRLLTVIALSPAQ